MQAAAKSDAANPREHSDQSWREISDEPLRGASTHRKKMLGFFLEPLRFVFRLESRFAISALFSFTKGVVADLTTSKNVRLAFSAVRLRIIAQIAQKSEA